MAKRRAPRVVWLPPDRFNGIGSTPGSGATVGTQTGVKRVLTTIPGGAGSAHTEVIPVVQDSVTETGLIVTGSLADYEQSAYRLRRIVGKIFVGLHQVAVEGASTEVVVTAGLIILRTHDVLGQTVPLNATTEEYSTQMLMNWADPWIWRRTWVLGNIPQETAVGGFPFYSETNTSGSGSAVDGPHVDAKTARIVGPEERLYLVITGASVNGDPQVNQQLDIIFELRALATMRSSQGNRRNASR